MLLCHVRVVDMILLFGFSPLVGAVCCHFLCHNISKVVQSGQDHSILNNVCQSTGSSKETRDDTGCYKGHGERDITPSRWMIVMMGNKFCIFENYPTKVFQSSGALPFNASWSFESGTDGVPCKGESTKAHVPLGLTPILAHTVDARWRGSDIFDLSQPGGKLRLSWQITKGIKCNRCREGYRNRFGNGYFLTRINVSREAGTYTSRTWTWWLWGLKLSSYNCSLRGIQWPILGVEEGQSLMHRCSTSSVYEPEEDQYQDTSPYLASSEHVAVGVRCISGCNICHRITSLCKCTWSFNLWQSTYTTLSCSSPFVRRSRRMRWEVGFTDSPKKRRRTRGRAELNPLYCESVSAVVLQYCYDGQYKLPLARESIWFKRVRYNVLWSTILEHSDDSVWFHCSYIDWIW